jgi:prevent-host-death family protein
MSEKVIPAGEFKARCLALMDEVAETREPIVVTKRGKPVVRILPAEEEDVYLSLRGSVTYASEEDLIAPLNEPWPGEREDEDEIWRT